MKEVIKMTEEKMYKQIQALRRYGETIVDIKKNLNDGLYRVLTIKYNNNVYTCIMRDGKAVMIDKVAKEET